MGLISGGTYYLCNVCLDTSGNTVESVFVNTPHPVYTTQSGTTVVDVIQKNAVTLGGFNGLNN